MGPFGAQRPLDLGSQLGDLPLDRATGNPAGQNPEPSAPGPGTEAEICRDRKTNRRRLSRELGNPPGMNTSQEARQRHERDVARRAEIDQMIYATAPPLRREVVNGLIDQLIDVMERSHGVANTAEMWIAMNCTLDGLGEEVLARLTAMKARQDDRTARN